MNQNQKSAITKNIAGISMKGGRRDNFYLSLIEYYADQDRWFLRSLLKVKDSAGHSDVEKLNSGESKDRELYGDEVIRQWIDKYSLHHLVVDIPLSYPVYHEQSRERLAIEQKNLDFVQNKIKDLLAADQQILDANPKDYEARRNRDDQVDVSRDIAEVKTHEPILSRAFKRRLKKGFLPYWNRTLDLWVWMHYYDQLLDLFNISFDSFGNTSLMNLFRFDYLKTHFPDELHLYEGHIPVMLIELLKSQVIQKKDILNLSDLDLCIEARLDIIKKIEKKLKIFIYDHDLEILVKKPRAFDSFLLAVMGRNIHLDQIYKLPNWTLPERTRFTVPDFKT